LRNLPEIILRRSFKISTNFGEDGLMVSQYLSDHHAPSYILAVETLIEILVWEVM